MVLAPAVRKLALTTHVTTSVGWLGAVVAFLALAVAGLTSQDGQTVRAAYLSMEALGRYVLVPLAAASLFSGLVQSLGSSWGLFRHYWVLTKLLMTVFATVVLLAYLRTLGYLADVATSGNGEGVLPSPSPLLHSGAALVVLLVAAVLSVYKPRGVTAYGQRKQRQASAQSQ